MDLGPSERPTILCLVTKGDGLLFEVIDLLELPRFEASGWRFVGIDPETEAAWLAWREQNPTAP